MSTRKPHNNLAGYVCELKSKHPKLPGHFAIFARDKGGDWVTGTGRDERYAVLHIKPDNTPGCYVTMPNLPCSREVMKDMAAGGNIADLGQYGDQYGDDGL
jgi:hypothetical protein